MPDCQDSKIHNQKHAHTTFQLSNKLALVTSPISTRVINRERQVKEI